MEYLTEEKIIDDEIAQRRSIEKFLMEVIYPKLQHYVKSVIDEQINRGVAIYGAFEIAGVDINMCIRG